MITVKEEFLTEEKTQRAIELGGYAAIVMWLALKGYAARKKTNGFIPDSVINKLAGAPKNPRKALEALVRCGIENEDGELGAGLVDRVQHGWQLHDYLDHATSSDELEERQHKDRLRKQLQRDRARLRKLLVESGHSVDGAERLVRNMSRDDVQHSLADMSRSQDVTGHVTHRDLSDRDAGCDLAGARSRASAPAPDPAQPSPAQPRLENRESRGEPEDPASGTHRLPKHVARFERAFAGPVSRDFEPNEENTRLAATRGVELGVEREKFIAHNESSGKTCVDWQAEFRLWLLRARKEAPRKAGAGGPLQPSHGMTGFEKAEVVGGD